MKVACFSTQAHDLPYLKPAFEASTHEVRFLKPELTPETVILADECDAVCAFVNDRLDRSVLEALKVAGIRYVVLRCAGFNNVDLQAAQDYRIRIARVPKYSPHAVAEHTIGLVLTLNRKIHKAYQRVRDNNFSLDGLIGFDLHGRTFGIIGTGEIGCVLARIVAGFGAELLFHDVRQTPQCSQLGDYVSLPELLHRSDVVSLHCPLNDATHHLIDADAMSSMKPGAMLVNTSRGGLVDSRAAIAALKSKHLGGFALDVYEEESGLFFNDLSAQVVQDDVLTRLMTFPNVLVTAHQAFLTSDALIKIAETTIHNLDQFAAGKDIDNEVVLVSQ